MRGKVLITGGLGNLGSWMTRTFAQSGYEVLVLSKKAKYTLKEVPYTLIEADISDLDALKQAIPDDIDYCIHIASMNEYFVDDYPKKVLLVNTLGTRNLLETLNIKQLKKFVYFSTFHVYGLQEGTITENTPPCPKNDYASTHLFAEYYVKQFHATHQLPYTIFRLTNSYGAPFIKESDKWYLVLNDLTRSAFLNQKIILQTNGNAKRDFIWMGDVCKITLNSLNVLPNDTYNLSSSQQYKVVELAQMVQEAYLQRYGKTIDIVTNDHDLFIYPELAVENRKLKSFIAYTPDNKFLFEINKIFDLLEE
jgi:UDP-glucose 4-epimerase